MLGYYTPGDGGGGVFDVVDSGQGPNGGTVFVPLEHQSAEVVSTAPFSKTLNVPGVPDGEDVVFGSLTLDLLDRQGDLVVTVPGEHLHGHTLKARSDLRPIFYYEDGIFYDNARPDRASSSMARSERLA